MSDSDGLITSDESESEAQFDSFSETTGSDERRKSSPPNVDLTIEESGAESDDNDSLVVRKPKKRVAIIASDSEEDDEEEDVEQRALSPRTRMSMTGIRPADLSDDSSEIDYSDEEQPETNDVPSQSLKGSSVANSFESAQEEQSDSVEAIESSDEESEEANSFLAKSAEETSEHGDSSREMRNKTNSFLANSATEESRHEVSTASDSQEQDGSSAAADDSADLEASSKGTPSKPQQKLPAGTPENIDSPLYAPRYSTVFASAIKDKLSSTICQTDQDKISSRPESDDSDIQIVNKTPEKTIEIFSSEDDDENPDVSYVATLPAMPTLPVRKPASSQLVQPKLFTAMPPPASNKKPPKAAATQYVSKEFYDKEVSKLASIKAEKSSAEALFDKVAKCLPDGGTQLKLRIHGLQRDIDIKESYIATLKIHDVGMEQKEAIKQHDGNPFFNKNAPDWDELSSAVNDMKPVHTGKQGLATFNTQKALTVERLKEMHVSLDKRPGEDVLADDPKGMRVKLMDHQKHALAWMAWREKQKPRGGILADDMGLGKTLTMISMVLAAKNREEEGDENADPAEKDEESESDDEQVAGKPKTWSTKGRRDYYNGGTLVVCPASLIRQWEGEVETKLSRHKLTVCVHHGNNRDTKPKHLRTYDIVVTTYQIVAREHKTHGALYGIKWRRIILDEAHVVRNHKAQSSLAVCELKGRYRWALTGTPIQNKEMDVYAILKFLKCSPFDDLAHWKKWIDNKSAGGQMRLNTLIQSLMLRRTKQQLQARGELNCLPSKEIKLIEVELDKEEMNVYQKIMIYSRTLFAQFLMQRAERSTDQMYRDESVKPTFMQTKDPNDAYYKVHQKFTRMHQHSGKEQIKSHQILVLLLRLRQICCHPGLIDAMLEDEETQVESEGDSTQPEIDLLDQLNKLAIKDDSSNGNIMLGNSMEEDVVCPEQEVISRASARVLQRSNPVFDLRRPSTKMLKVLETIRSCVLDSNDKAIIVSQWTSVLNILRTHLEEQGIATLSLNGQIAVKNRQEIVTDFNNANSRKKVLLLSLTAGGVGLNLVGANHLLLIDLHWNPQLEAQAQDRIYRVGQKKNVFIYKFMCKDTVEARIRALQEHKLQIANGVLTGAKQSAGTKLTIDDLKGLFGM